MPKCINFEANGAPPEPTCGGDEALRGYTLDDGQPPAGANHIFAYTHGFCGPTGKGTSVEASEAAWCQKVASGCGMSYPSGDWHGEKGADCLVKYVAANTPDKAHFEIDNCSKYSGGDLKCYQDLLAAMKKNNMGARRLLIKNVDPGQATALKSVFEGADSKMVSNFVIVEEEFDKAAVQSALGGTCASVAQSKDTTKYGVNENHIGNSAPAQVASAAGRIQ